MAAAKPQRLGKQDLQTLYASFLANELTTEEETMFRAMLVRAGLSPIAVRANPRQDVVDRLMNLNITPAESYRIRAASPIATR